MPFFARNGELVENPDTVMPRPDFMASDFGDELVLFPKTDEACMWVARNLPDNAPMCGAGVIADPRTVDIIIGDGLVVA